jgi:pimeloyl-ACP methyl ester carboxylesterase
MNGWALSMEYVSTYGRVRWDFFGGGPPLVLVHSTPFSSYVWRKVVPALAEANTVYAFDLPGYGSSEMRVGQDVSLAAQGRVLSELLDHWGLDKPAVVGHDFGGAITLRAHLLEGRDFRAIALIDAVALSSWGSPFYRLVQDYVGVFRHIPAYMHEAMVAAYVRDATYVPMDDAMLGPYIEPWLGAEGQEAFYRQIFQNDPRYTDEVQPPLHSHRTARADRVGRRGPVDTSREGQTVAQSHTWLATEDDTPLRPPRPGGRPRGRGRVTHGLFRSVGACSAGVAAAARSGDC